MQLKIRGKLVVSFTAVIGMVLTALGFITYLTFAESIQENKEEIARLHLTALEFKLNTYIDQQFHELKELGQSLPPLGEDGQLPAVQIELLDAFLESNAHIRNITISNREGNILFSSSASDALELFGRNRTREGGGQQVITDHDGIWLVSPHNGRSGTANNQLAIQLKVGEIMEKLMRDTALNQAELLIFKDQKLIYSSLPEGITADHLPHSPDPSASEEGQFMPQINGNYIFTAFQKRLGWQLDFLLPESVIRKDLINLKNRLITAVVIVLWTSIWIVLIVAHRISQPLRSLSRATQDIQEFNYSTPIEFPITHDEISDLAASFESMRIYIKGQVSRDPLTNLSNRRYMMHAMGLEIAKALRTHQSISVVMVDLDHFKAVNDTYGHQGGDHILVETAKVLQAGVRQYDIAARYGGEEFALVLPFTDSDGAMIVAERIRIALEQTVIDWDGKEVRVTMSVGIATVQFDETIENGDVQGITFGLFEQADAALYLAKEGGRNRCEVYRQDPSVQR